ncbi:MAG: hypothetical protein U5Q44_14555 [Dehalococcoidia bacterium]|nr:hypothetical protein [Dehalococcoidia bacterium]
MVPLYLLATGRPQRGDQVLVKLGQVLRRRELLELATSDSSQPRMLPASSSLASPVRAAASESNRETSST